MFFELMGIIFIGLLAIFIPRTILAIVTWNVINHQAEFIAVHVLLTLAAIVCDYKILKEK
jgi:hypothetical protein